MDLSFVTRKFQRSMAGLSLLAILASFAGFTGTAFANTFSDVSSSYFAYDQIDSLSTDGIMTGYENGLFGPSDTLTREQAAKILVEAFVGSVDSSYDAGFSDVAAGQWYTDYVNTAALYGIASGNPDGTFGVGHNINRADFAKMVVSAAGLESDGTVGSDMFNDVNSGTYYDAYVGTAWAYSIVDGTSSTTYAPSDSVTRGQAAKMTYNAMNPVYRGTVTPIGSPDATVTVAVSNDTAQADTLPSNATSVSLASFDFTAEGADSVLDGLTVHQYGISSASTMTVYLYEGAQRLTSGTTVNSTTHESNFRNLNLDLPQGDTVTLTVRGDMGTWAASGEVGFEIASADKVDVGDSSVSGDFPTMGEKFSVSTTAVGSVTIQKNGNVDNAQVGEDDAYVAKFTMTAGSTEGGYVQELGVYLSGTISTQDVENFRLYVSGNDSEPIAQVDNVDSLDVVRFVAGEGEGVMSDISTGYYLEKGQSKNFYVLADFNTGRTSDTVGMYIDQDTDVRVVGDLYGYGLSVTRTAYDGNSNSCAAVGDVDCTFQTITGGDITVSSNGPAATDVAINGKDISLLNFTVASVTDVTFDTFPVALTPSESATDTTEGLLNGTAANFTDIKIVDTDSGDQIYSSIDADTLITANATSGTAITEAAGDNAIAYHNWTDDWFVAAGSEYNLALETDIANTSTLDPMTIIGSLPFTSAIPVLKDVNNKTLTNSSVLVPNSSITGKTMTVRAPSLTLSLASTPAVGSNSYVKGASDVQFTGIVFACGQSSACRVTDVTLQGYLDDDGNASAFVTTATGTHTSALSSYVGSVALVDSDGNTVAASKAVNTSTFVVTYTNMDWSIGAGQTEIVYVTGDISNDAFANGDAENIAFGISSVNNVTTEDGDGNTFAVTNTVNTAATTYVATTQGGTLTVAVDSATARENIVISGTSNVEVSKFELTATREAFTVSKLSLSNRQSAVTSTTTLGDYDNNVASVKISYEDSAGATQTSTGYLVSGTAQFSGLDLYVPADGSTTITAYVTLNTISTSGSSATAGEWVDLAMAFDTFEAVSEDSGSTYKAGNLDAGSANLSIGTITWLDSGYDTNYPVTELTTGAPSSSQALTIDTGTTVFPVGTLLCIGAGTTTCAATDSEFVTTATWSTTAPTVMVVDNADASVADGLNVMYALPGAGYFTGTNQMVVYESKPTLALASTSPSGSRSVSASDDAFVFSVTANSNEKIQVKAANDFPTCSAGGQTMGGTLSAVQTGAGLQVDGSGCSIVDGAYDSADYTSFAASASTQGANSVDNYSYVSFWFQFTDNSAAMTTLVPAFLNVGTEQANTGTADQTTVVAASNILGSPTVLAESTWYFVHDVATPTGTDNDDAFVTVGLVDGTVFEDAADDIYIDQVRMYTQKIEVDLAADGDIDQTYDLAGTNPIAATLRESGNTVATGYVDIVGVGDSDGTADAADGTDATSAVITFIPTSTQGNIEIAAGATKSYTVNLSTNSLLADDSGVEDPLTFSIDYGSSSSGSVTAGDFWWYETNANVRWLGQVSSTSLTSNTVKY